MGKFIVEGGNSINGYVNISGSKNSALPILAATLLISDTCVIDNVPRLSDVYTMIELLKYYGAYVEFENSIKVDCRNIKNKLPSDKVREIRASFLLVGALLGRFNNVSMFMPGGCKLVSVQ